MKAFETYKREKIG